MGAIEYDLEIDRGSKYSREFVWQNEDGSAVNLTGYSGRLEIRESPGSTIILALSSGAGITITPLTGTVAIVITGAQSAAFSFDTAQYDLLLWNATDSERLAEGVVYVDRQITVKP